MALSMTYQLSAPSLEGCNSCGQNIVSCQCHKFEKTTPRDGVPITSPQYLGTLSSFASYANPTIAHNANHAPSSARTFSSVIDGKGDSNGLAESAAIAAPNAGVASGPAGF